MIYLTEEEGEKRGRSGLGMLFVGFAADPDVHEKGLLQGED